MSAPHTCLIPSTHSVPSEITGNLRDEENQEWWGGAKEALVYSSIPGGVAGRSHMKSYRWVFLYYYLQHDGNIFPLNYHQSNPTPEKLPHSLSTAAVSVHKKVEKELPHRPDFQHFLD